MNFQKLNGAKFNWFTYQYHSLQKKSSKNSIHNHSYEMYMQNLKNYVMNIILSHIYSTSWILSMNVIKMSNFNFRLTKYIYIYIYISNLRCDFNMLLKKSNCKNKNVDYNFFSIRCVCTLKIWKTLLMGSSNVFLNNFQCTKTHCHYCILRSFIIN